MTALETALHRKLTQTPHAYIPGAGLAVGSTAMPNVGNWRPEEDVQETVRFIEMTEAATDK